MNQHKLKTEVSTEKVMYEWSWIYILHYCEILLVKYFYNIKAYHVASFESFVFKFSLRT